METEQYTAEWSVHYRINKGGYFKNPKTKWKWRYNLPEPLRHNKGNAKENFTAIVPTLGNQWELKYIN
jgi:hypothetical protein